MSIVWDVMVDGEYYCTVFTRMGAGWQHAYERACIMCEPLNHIRIDRVELRQNVTTMFSPSTRFDEE